MCCIFSWWQQDANDEHTWGMKQRSHKVPEVGRIPNAPRHVALGISPPDKHKVLTPQPITMGSLSWDPAQCELRMCFGSQILLLGTPTGSLMSAPTSSSLQKCKRWLGIVNATSNVRCIVP